MADEPELPPAYKAIHATAKKLEADGIEPDAIIDALLVIGLNHAHRRTGKKGILAILKKMTVLVRAGVPVTSTRH